MSDAAAAAGPFDRLRAWVDDGERAGAPSPLPASFCTVDHDGRPSARIVGLKRVDDDGLLFTTALWTRKAREVAANPHVALVIYWEHLGRQVTITGRAAFAPRALAEELFAERPRAHQLQTKISRQGEPIESLEPLRDRLAALETTEDPVGCPPDWGAVRVVPEQVEFWEQAPDRLHDRHVWTRGDAGWTITRVAP